MKVKDRAIQIRKSDHSFSEGDCFIVDEYGIEDERIYHRYIVINDHIYEAFQDEPDDEEHLDKFLKRHDINAEWKPYKLSTSIDENDTKESSKLLDEIDFEDIPSEVSKWNEQTKNKVYKKIYDELAKKETLINNPLIIDVFNEAFKEDPELGSWESVFPFFR